MLTSTISKRFQYEEFLYLVCIVGRVGYFERRIYAELKFYLPTL